MTSTNGRHSTAYRWRDYRCTGTSMKPCNRLLLRMRYDPNVIEGIEIEIRCSKCSKMNVIGASAQPSEEDTSERETARQAE